MSSRMDNPPSIQSRTSFPGGQPVTVHCFLPCQCFHTAHASNTKVMAAKTGRYGSMAMKTDAEPSPSSTIIKGPIQQADAKPPAMTAPIRGALLFSVVRVLLASMNAD